MGKIVSRALQVRLSYQQRIERPVTISEVARETGLTRSAITNMEARRTVPNGDSLAALCKFYGVQPGDLLEYVDEDRLTRATAGRQPMTVTRAQTYSP